MKEYIRSIHFIEEIQNIEGSCIEVRTLFVNEDKTKALNIRKRSASKKTNSFRLILSEYKIKAEKSYFYQLLKRWSKLLVDFYRRMQIINCQPLAETHAQIEVVKSAL